jgi:hypothetical protein
MAIAEKIILFDAPNGENIHRNVFRKSVFPVAGLTITPAETIGDSIVILGAVKTHAEWKGVKFLQLHRLVRQIKR